MNKIAIIWEELTFVPRWHIWLLLMLALIGVNVVMVLSSRGNSVVATNVSCNVTGINYGNESKITLAISCDHDGQNVITSVVDSAIVGKVLQTHATKVVCEKMYQSDSLDGCEPVQ